MQSVLGFEFKGLYKLSGQAVALYIFEGVNWWPGFQWKSNLKLERENAFPSWETLCKVWMSYAVVISQKGAEGNFNKGTRYTIETINCPRAIRRPEIWTT